MRGADEVFTVHPLGTTTPATVRARVVVVGGGSSKEVKGGRTPSLVGLSRNLCRDADNSCSPVVQHGQGSSCTLLD
eukprot:scaffold196954_cov18-Tisochrysis_lutea.AAC.2